MTGSQCTQEAVSLNRGINNSSGKKFADIQDSRPWHNRDTGNVQL